MERIISVTDLVRHAARIAEDVEAAGTIYRITRGGRGSMVLVDEDYFEGWLAAIDEMRRPDWQAAWSAGSRDIAAGRGRGLDVVAKELGLEGSAHRERGEPVARTARARRSKDRDVAAAPPGRPKKRPRVPR